jgi:hypothetical protein
MKSYYPQVTLSGNKMTFNSEAIETMELDVDNASVIFIEVTNPDKVKNNKDILIMKTNGSLCDDPENVKDIIDPKVIRKVNLDFKDGDIVSGSVDITKDISTAINDIFGPDKDSFKLLVCNIESPVGKEFKEQFEIKDNYYKIANLNDKRTSVGKDKNTKSINVEERININ